ncbi:ABC transporter permease [Allomuricauda sp. M10]|uniref:ABC transporter permease n=1 Tax=Allomuricauda sp. M10 TaxID=2683292 RepID=UPI001D1828DF|nr:ABC transporter permease [Muricauda sp. M10]
MIKNYLKIAWRNLIRNKIYSSINIIGLSLGLAACMLIVIYLGHEYSYDKFHENADNIYLGETEITFGKDPIYMPYMGYSEGPKSKQEIPSIEDYLRYKKNFENVTIQNPEYPELKFSEDNFLFADPNFFSFFSFPLLQGDRDEVLKSPFSAVISQNIAERYFGGQNPIGKTFLYNDQYIFTVRGVAKITPSNSNIAFDFVASISSMASMEEYQESLKEDYSDFTTYFSLAKSSDPAIVEAALLNISGQKEDDVNKKYLLRPLTSLHFGSDFANSRYIKIFPLVAILILLLALVNYASLSTARSTTRSKEVGVRKVLGAHRKAIALQFFFESALYTVISFVLGYFLCLTVQPFFFGLLDIQMDNSFLYAPQMLVSLVGLLVLTILLAAIYPAILLSAYRPMVVLHGKLSAQSSGASVRKFFAIFQFGISTILIICAIVIDRQMYFFRHIDTGIDRENIVMLPFSADAGTHVYPFKQEIQAIPEVLQSSIAILPLYKGHNMMGVKSNNDDAMIFLPTLTVDEKFISMLNLKWETPPIDSLLLNGQKTVAIINKMAIEKLNLEGNPITQKINGQYVINGVLKDFVYTSLHHKIDALCLLINKTEDETAPWAKYGGVVYAKIAPNSNIPSTLQQMKAVYEKYDAEKPFEYHFLNETFNAQYKAEDRLALIFSAFTGLAILIAVMGLFGLATFIALQRRKEIGIRKVLGASIGNVTTLLSLDFLKLVVLAIIIASPTAYWLMNQWLQNFAYRISISWWMFIMAAIGTLLLALFTISFQAIKSATANPVKSLRTE